MVHEGIILSHKRSSKGVKVDRAKIGVIEQLSSPINVKRVRSFYGHTCFNWRFIKIFSKISKPL